MFRNRVRAVGKLDIRAWWAGAISLRKCLFVGSTRRCSPWSEFSRCGSDQARLRTPFGAAIQATFETLTATFGRSPGIQVFLWTQPALLSCPSRDRTHLSRDFSVWNPALQEKMDQNSHGRTVDDASIGPSADSSGRSMSSLCVTRPLSRGQRASFAIRLSACVLVPMFEYHLHWHACLRRRSGRVVASYRRHTIQGCPSKAAFAAK